VYVPDGLVGGTPESAQSAIELAELTYADGGPVDSDLPVGTVASTDPPGGTQVPRGTTVTVYTSNGQDATAPPTTGLTFAAGQSAFQTAGFSTISQACQVAPTGTLPTDPTIGTIITQTPVAGAVVNVSTPVVLTIRKIACP
jgi:beta-lactam-binding protein with PASTA domain